MTKKIKLFVPLLSDEGEKSKISLHFGHAPYFGLYDFKSEKLNIIKNNLNHSDPNKSPVEQVLEEMSPNIVFAQDMGMRAINLFKERNIKLVTGPQKTIKDIIDNFDELENLDSSCGH